LNLAVEWGEQGGDVRFRKIERSIGAACKKRLGKRRLARLELLDGGLDPFVTWSTPTSRITSAAFRMRIC
jgi:hypothetical protein